MQDELTLAVDPRYTSVRASGCTDPCTMPTVGDARAGFRCRRGGGDTPAQSRCSLLHLLVAGGAPDDPASPGTGGSRHVRTVVLAQNTLRGDW